MQKILLALTITLLLSLASGGVLVYAVNAAAPGDLLYGVDRGLEAMRLGLTRSEHSILLLQSQYAFERLGELQSLAARGDQQYLEDSLAELAADEATRDGAYCRDRTGERHPTGDKLAQRYSTGYDVIMGWFCDGGYGFGEIDLAYRIAQAAGIPVEQVFDTRASGMGWGNVLKEYGLDMKPDKPPKQDNGNGNAYGHDKDKDKDKDNHKDKDKDKGKDKDKTKP